MVEDNAVNLKVMHGLLKYLGLSCVTAVNGQEALNVLRKEKVDLVFMDCQMPVMDGFEATRAIRQIERKEHLRAIPIIAMTANAMEGDRERCLDTGMDDYLAKPVSREDIYQVIERWVPEVKINHGHLKQAQVAEPESKQREEASPLLDGHGTPLLDDQILDELKEVVGDEVNTIVETYLKSVPDSINQLRKYLLIREIEKSQRIAHSLKSSSANVGAMRISSLSKKVELYLRREKYDKALPYLKPLIQALPETVDRLNGYIGK